MMQLAKMVGELATGEATEPDVPTPDAAAVKRGKARDAALSPQEKTEIARLGGLAKAANRTSK